jgi:hypothetical protein
MASKTAMAKRYGVHARMAMAIKALRLGKGTRDVRAKYQLSGEYMKAIKIVMQDGPECSVPVLVEAAIDTVAEIRVKRAQRKRDLDQGGRLREIIRRHADAMVCGFMIPTGEPWANKGMR